jgi:branched-chain amino acid transport system ATP-binding protein
MADAPRSEALALRGVTAGYGETVVLDDVSLALRDGDTLALLGRNGVGKTTLLATVMGHTNLHRGTIAFAGQQIENLTTYRRARLGIGYVPQEREIFPSLNVDENLTVAARAAGGRSRWSMVKVFELFPQLGNRRRNMGNQLSGGEQQMLAIGRALMTNPRLLILDEATEGLAPLVRQEIWSVLGRLKREGQSILVIDKNVEALTRIADRHYLIERGRVVWSGTSSALAAAPDVQHRYLGI